MLQVRRGDPVEDVAGELPDDQVGVDVTRVFTREPVDRRDDPGEVERLVAPVALGDANVADVRPAEDLLVPLPPVARPLFAVEDVALAHLVEAVVDERPLDEVLNLFYLRTALGEPALEPVQYSGDDFVERRLIRVSRRPERLLDSRTDAARVVVGDSSVSLDDVHIPSRCGEYLSKKLKHSATRSAGKNTICSVFFALSATDGATSTSPRGVRAPSACTCGSSGPGRSPARGGSPCRPRSRAARAPS